MGVSLIEVNCKEGYSAAFGKHRRYPLSVIVAKSVLDRSVQISEKE